MTERRHDRRWLSSKLSVYLVADPDQTRHDLARAVEAALANGVTAVQLRAKRGTDRETLELARRLNQLCRNFDALFVVNDRLDLALASEAGGVHLGVGDLPVDLARRLGGEALIVGYSPETGDQTRQAAHLGADYVGVGPVYTTASKDDAYSEIGPLGLARLSRIAQIPTVGIGGITPANAAAVIEAGAVGVAVIGAILRAGDPGAAAANLAATVNAARGRITDDTG